MTQDRLIELEIRYTYQQDTIKQLSDVVAEQGRLLGSLRADVEALRRQLDLLRTQPADERPPADDPPPHY